MIFLWVVLAATCMVPDLGKLLPGLLGRVVTYLCAAIWCIIVLATVIYWFAATWRGRMVAVTPDGLFLRDELEPVVIPWPNVGNVEILSGSRVRVTRADFGEAIDIEHIFSSDAKSRQFRRRVLRAKQAYGQPGVEADEEPSKEP